MSIPTFTQGYPPDGSSLGNTKSTIRNNLDGTFLTVGVDHVNNNGQPGSNPAGYHTVIHEVPQTSVDTVTGYNQVFSGVPGNLVVNGVTTAAIPPTDTQLYSLSGNGVLSQLTGSGSNSNGSYQWIGSFLFQWGVNVTTGNASQAFPVTFPNNLLSLTLGTRGNAGSSGYSRISSESTNSFTVQQVATSGFYWMAIGN